MSTTQPTLIWKPMPSEPKSGPRTSDGWRDYGHDRRQRVPFDLERIEKQKERKTP